MPIGKYTRRLKPTIERILKRLSKDAITGCWNFTGYLDPNGYGRVGHYKDSGEKFIALTHQITYRHFYGSIADGLELDHKCRNPACCNPDHLEPVTHAENIRRGKWGSFSASKTHCPRGHAYNEKNTMISNGRRYCRMCAREWDRQRRHPDSHQLAP